MKIISITSDHLGFPIIALEPSSDGSIHLPTIMVELGWFKSKAEAGRVIKTERK